MSSPAQGMAFDVDIRPDVSALRLFKSLSFTPWYALGEFVDNSISSYLSNRQRLEQEYGPDYALRIDITIEQTSGRISIQDNAAGISQQELPRALRTGHLPPDTSNLNLHGVGMKAAAFWWGRSLTIKTWPLCATTGWELQIDIGEDETTPTTNLVTVNPIPQRTQSGTRIVLDNLWQDIPSHAKTRRAIRAYLPSIYRRFITSDGSTPPITMTLDGEELSFDPPTLLREPYWPDSEGPIKGAEPILWRREVDLTLSSGKRVFGWVGILETLSREVSGFVLHYRGKGVSGVTPVGEKVSDSTGFRPKAIFGQVGSYRGQSYIGEFDVSEFGKSITTDSTLWSPEEQDEFIEAMLQLLKDPTMDFWSMAVNFKRRKRDQQDSAALQRSARKQVELLQDGAEGTATHAQPVDPHTEEVDLTSREGDLAFVIHDQQSHEHHFTLRYEADHTELPFLQVGEDRDRLSHMITINEAHPCLSDFPPANAASRALLTRLMLALGSAEVFVDSPDRKDVRAKFNEHLNFFRSKDEDPDELVS